MQWSVPRELLWAIIGALAIAVIALFPSHYPYSQTPKVNPQQESAKGVSGGNESEHAPTGLEQPSSDENKRDGREHAQDTEIWKVKRGEWLLFLATLGLWYATWRLVRGADQTARRQLRAYVFITEAAIKNFGAGLVPKLTYTYRNTGQTPAYKLTSISAIIIRKTDDISPFPKPEDTPTYVAGEHPQWSLGPQMVIATGPDLAEIPLTAAQISGIGDGSLALYFFGEIKYRDVFRRDRFTKFRLIYGKNNIGQSALTVPAEGNETEEESNP